MSAIVYRGANGLPFEKEYWDDMYIEDDESVIDGVFNAVNHARYVYELMQLFEISIHTIGDFGFGLGILLREFASVFKPKKIVAIDPSAEAINRILAEKWISSYNIAIQQNSIELYDSTYLQKYPLDLVICNSVLQYVPNNKVEICFEKLSKICKYLYITIPTVQDYKFMKSQLNFTDPYAFSRSKTFYTKLYKKYFTCVSHNLLESKSTIISSPIIFELFRL